MQLLSNLLTMLPSQQTKFDKVFNNGPFYYNNHLNFVEAYNAINVRLSPV